MSRTAIIFALMLIAATDVSAGETQRLNSEPPRKYGDAQSGFWGSFRPAPSDPGVRAQAAEQPPTTNYAPQGESGVRSNISQPEAEAIPPEQQPRRTVTETPRQETPRKRRTKRAEKKVTRSAPKKQEKVAKEAPRTEEAAAEERPGPAKRSRADARWWEETGNPAVFAFSSCVADYATASARAHVDLPHAEYVTKALAGPCKGQFDSMASLILKRHGEKGFATVSKELIDTTFIPAVRDALAKASAEIRDEERHKITLGAELQQAKSDMFACFVREADQRAAASAQAPQVIAEAVIETCGTQAQKFFAKLDELYPDASADERRTQQSALRQNYLPAILSRVAAMRASASVSAQQ